MMSIAALVLVRVSLYAVSVVAILLIMLAAAFARVNYARLIHLARDKGTICICVVSPSEQLLSVVARLSLLTH